MLTLETGLLDLRRTHRSIALLPDRLISQIAAGEVVERPASVVKELLENAIDAGASCVDLRIESGGTRLISVSDNGYGIPAEELPLALLRHATSKIHSLAELEQVQSLGFRGEALASIASVAHVRILSRSRHALTAAQIDSTSQQISPAARSVGTTVEVRDLYADTPARRKFLKSGATETAYCVDCFRRLALVHAQVDFSVQVDQRPPERMSASDQVTRARDAMGLEPKESHCAFDVRSGRLQIQGVLSNPTKSRARANRQFLYVNGRSVRDRGITQVMKQAYADMLHGDRHPSWALFIEIDPAEVDVNVHPTRQRLRAS